MRFSVVLTLLFITNCIFAQWGDVNDAGARKIGEVYSYIDRLYVDSVDHDAITEAAIVSMLEELDPHSTYISAEDVRDANQRIDGSFVGVGIRFQIVKDTLYVVNSIPNGPAQKVGVMAGDKIIKIEEELVAGIGLKNNDVREKLLGEKGSKVKVSILRKSKEGLIDFTITRDKIPVHSVISKYMVDDKVGYIKLTNFSRTTKDEVKTAIKELKKSGMEDLILDLQGNTGGLLYAAKYVADEFLADDRLIVYSKGRAQPKSVLLADEKGQFEKGRLVVLIDEGSASASEIVAGAIQDWDRGLLVGRRTFGKGLVQRPVELSDGSQIRLTIARYYTPSGRFIQKPYKDLDAYRKDYYERFMGGEMMSKDSVKINDSLKFETMVQKRLVYGGGGIMPDEFVPLDTSEYSEYYKDVSRSGVINSFALNYADDKRNEIKQNYEDLSAFISDFEADEDFMSTFFEYAEKEDTSLVYNADDYELSGDLIRARLKAMIGQNIWDYTAYYQIINPKNEIFMRGYEILRGNRYDKMNLSSN